MRYKDNPRRLNYLLWVEDLLGLLPDSDALRAGLDIGAGASAVYSLLGAAHFKWRMVSTEADSSNFEAATENVQNNKLNSSVKIIKVVKSDIFLKAFESNQDFDFSMCNPPFYTKEKKFKDEDIAGIESEVKTNGGEVELKRGRFGSYIEHKKLRASLPRGTEMSDVTLEQAIALLKEKYANSTKKKKSTKKVSTGEKKVSKSRKK